ncbi:MAG: RraA family protein [Gammaproteobacteria bacterium]|nr:RraA family protein [Gammaproteobacteria bacterium]
MSKKPKSAEIHPGPGFRVQKTITRVAKEVIDQFRQFETPDISDLMNRLYTMTSEIHNVANDLPIIGPAVTVKVFPGDNLMVHKALDVIQPGDVIVVDTGGVRTNAVLGDLVSNKAKHRGAAGFIIDGLIRDIPGVKEVGIPVYARGVSPIGPLHRGPGELNYPISCGGIVVNPGDLVYGDDCGVVVVRQEFAEEILARCYEQQKALSDYVANVKKGKFSNDWVDQVLEEASCRFSV